MKCIIYIWVQKWDFQWAVELKKLDVQDVMNQLLAYSSTHPTMAPCLLFPIPLVTETSSSSSVICQGNKISLHVYIYIYTYFPSFISDAYAHIHGYMLYTYSLAVCLNSYMCPKYTYIHNVH